MTATIQSVLETFPKRPMRLLMSPIGSPLRNILIMLGCLALAGLFGWLTVPGIVRDWQISLAPVTVRDADLSDGRCKTHFVIVECSAKVSYKVGGVSYRAEPSVMFVGLDGYDRASVVRSAEQPEVATLDIALEEMWNQIITAALLVALFVGIAGYVLVVVIPEALRSSRLVKEEIPVEIVPPVVEITSSTRRYAMTTHNFA